MDNMIYSVMLAFLLWPCFTFYFITVFLQHLILKFLKYLAREISTWKKYEKVTRMKHEFWGIRMGGNKNLYKLILWSLVGGFKDFTMLGKKSGLKD